MVTTGAAKDGRPSWLLQLLRRDAFPHRADNLRVVETHISWVILAGAYAYKFRKPVGFGFLDFSTRGKRRADCENEVRLNRRLCPDLYLGVVEVVARDRRVLLGGDGEPIEPAVRMRRPSRGCPACCPHSSSAVWPASGSSYLSPSASPRFTRRLPQAPGVDEHGSLQRVRGNWAENFVQTEPFVGRTISAAARDEVKLRTHRPAPRRSRVR